MTALAGGKCGPVAALIIEQIASNGSVQASDIAKQINISLPTAETVSPLKIKRTLRALASHGFIKRVRPAYSQILHDVRDDVDLQIQQRPGVDSKAKGKKAQEQHTMALNTELEQRFDSHLSLESFDVSEEQNNELNAVNWSSETVNVGTKKHRTVLV